MSTEPLNEGQSGENQQPEGQAGGAESPCPSVTLAVYRAELAAEPAGTTPAGGAGSLAADYPDGFTGTLALQNLEAFDEATVGEALVRMEHLISWGQAQRAHLLNRMEQIFRHNFFDPSERDKPGIAFSLAAAECAAILNVPQVTGQRLLSEAGQLCGTHTATLAGLEEGRFSYQHAQVVLEQCRNVPSDKLPGFEADLLKAAEGQTRAQFSAKARRLREKTFPETVSKRHLTAFEQRKVTLDREEDGMSCLSAYLRAAEAQQIYTALSTAARGEQSGGDSRTTDQLRADILAQLLMGGSRGLFVTTGTSDEAGTQDATGVRPGAGTGAGTGGEAESRGEAGNNSRAGHTGDDTDGTRQNGGSIGFDGVPENDGGLEDSPDTKARPDAGSGPDEGIVPRTEIMVLISAETLFGADDEPAELHGYGPISAEEARRLARNAAGWTGLAQDPKTGEILGVGRRRKVPAGLRRWLRARDGTCRFPGCRVNTANADIDHTIDWARGGPTDHGNLEHLCRRHHRFKTLGFWKACQPTPGVIEWTSPTGRVYKTEPFLELGPPDPAVEQATHPPNAQQPTDHGEKDPRQASAPPF
ncbi:HNH endonuclease signature motif containing protein [Arthrobacter sp. zg-Y1110]|uniref:HNH endonuclease n=1 Tax=Arthrobacter sp. zg-Y1110 TaxID=2886932 RepID=UPI001D133456|nr:HNH endonuclease signature motif containing protein [Arthrobacter sp. zg-Y1110]MCC3292181.1 HNH endonuclease [Arthrobacter sp. zg-Y1110]UWX85268.1 HNH endonuclease [Arthrobacter sp. zg-Y1110]